MSIFDSDTFNNVLAPSVAAPQADEIGVSPDATSLEVVQASTAHRSSDASGAIGAALRTPQVGDRRHGPGFCCID